MTTATTKRKTASTTSSTKSSPRPNKKSKTTPTPTPSNGGGAGGGGSSKKKILACLATLRKRGIVNASRNHVAAMCGVSKKTLANALSIYKSKGWVEYPDKDTVTITDKAMKEAAAEIDDAGGDFPTSNEAIHDEIKQKYLKKGKMCQVFDILADGRAHSKQDVAERIGAKSKNMANILADMKKIGIVEYPDSKQVQLATEMCFPFGRPADA